MAVTDREVMKELRLRVSLHMPVLLGLVLTYVVAVLAMWAVPHRSSGFGRMNAHQFYARLGYAATFGVVDRTLVDWYMRGPTLEDNVGPYNRVVGRSTLVLSGPFILWFCLVAVIVGTLRSTRARLRSACSLPKAVEPNAAKAK